MLSYPSWDRLQSSCLSRDDRHAWPCVDEKENVEVDVLMQAENEE